MGYHIIMIERLTIEGFKSIRSASVDFEPTTVLIGKSGTGKSNVLAALRFLRDFLAGSQQQTRRPKDWDWAHIQPANDRQAPLRLAVRFRLPDHEQAFAYEISFAHVKQSADQPPRQHLESESLHVGERQVYARDANGWQKEPPVNQPPQPQAGPMLGHLPTLTEAVLAHTALTTGIGFYEFGVDVLGRGQTNQQTPQYEGLDDNATNYLAAMQALTRDLRNQHARKTIVSRLKQLNPSVGSIELDSVLTPKQIVVGHRAASEDRRFGLNLAQESDGFRRFFAHLLALYQVPPKAVLMFEEPENGVFPGALSILAEEFRQAPSEQRGQVVLTTHSPDLLDHFPPETIRVVELDEQTNTTRVGPLEQDQLHALRDQLLDPGELLTVDHARAERATEQSGA